MFDINNLVAIQVGLASPEEIRNWSHGEVTRPETINYRSQKPEPGGLFCEKLFGPHKDYECYCGKYKKIRYQGFTCEKCGVEVISKEWRRERFGHIELVSPCTHIWYLKGIPSRMALILGIPAKQLEEIVYFAAHVVLRESDPTISTVLQRKDFLDEANAREKFVACIESFKPLIDPESADYMKANELIEKMNNKQETFDFFTNAAFITKYTGAEFGEGAAAIKQLLHEVDLDAEFEAASKDVHEATGQNRLKVAKRLEVIQSFRDSKQKPEWMILDVIPVIPPDLRPMLQLDGGRFAASDLNDLYRRVISRNTRLKKLIDMNAPYVILMNEKRMLQEAVDALIDNGRRNKPVTGPNGRPLKSLSSGLKGKQGRFRQNLLGKRVDYSGRSVIAVGPSLKMYQCGLPREMAIQLLRPFIAALLIKRGHVTAHKQADKIIDRYDSVVFDIVEEIVGQHPVLLNRAPTLHRLGIQAFQPVLVDGHAIRLHPLVCPGFNADFDGDQMAVHVPLGKEAQEEVLNLMLASNNILGPKDGKPIVIPGQDMILGNYYLTQEESKEDFLMRAKALREIEIFDEEEKRVNEDKAAAEELYAALEGKVFSSVNEVIEAYEGGHISIHNRIAIRAEKIHKTFAPETDPDNIKEYGLPFYARGKYLLTTVGKVMFNEIFPDDFNYINEKPGADVDTIKSWFVPMGTDIKEAIAATPLRDPIKKKQLGAIIDLVFHKYDMNEDGIVKKLQDLSDEYQQTDHSNPVSFINRINEMIEKEIAIVGEASLAQETKHNHIIRKVNEIIASIEAEGVNPDLVMERIKRLLLEPYPSKTSAVLDKIKDQGFKYSTLSSVTVSLNDITPVNGKEELVEKYREKVAHINMLAYDKGFLSEDERHEQVVKLWQDCTEDVRKLVKSHVARPEQKHNPVIIMLDSGSRGSIDNFNQLEGMKGLVAAARGSAHKDYVYEMPIVSSYRQGLSIAEYFHNTHGSRKGGADTALKTADSGYLTRRLVDVAQDVIVREEDCHCDHGFKVREIVDTARNVVLVKLKDRLIGRYSMHDIVNPQTGEIIVKGNTLISEEAALAVVAAGIKEVEIRSLFTCQTKSGVCQHCYGLNMATGHLVELGEAVGIMAAQSIGEPGTQLTMRVFHTGGMATTDITQGLPRVQEIVEARNPKGEALISEIDGVVTDIKNDDTGRKTVVITSNSKVTAESSEPEIKEYLTGYGARLRVKVGDVVEAGGKITEGAIKPGRLLEVSSVEKVQVYMIKEIHKVYAAQGIGISDKHLEVIIRQMLRKMVVVDGGDTPLLPGIKVDVERYTACNQEALLAGKRPALAYPLVLGITKAALETESFLSAASFQETTRILTDAAIKAKTDPLHGLKENVITGKLIPAGTGLLSREEEARHMEGFSVEGKMRQVKAQYIEAHDRQEVLDK
ncbi:MAG: DNA-directed RNA polymerase subunit beta' [Bacilli bacterium]|nr:DNA-directed RNA polymerase subunit beta' [Bacilli bacterium]